MMLFGLITVFLGWHLQFLSFDFEFEKFFPKNDPDSQFYEIHKQEFGYDNDFLSIILQTENVFDQSFLRRAQAFEDSVSQLDFVTSITSGLSQKHLINGPTGLMAFPLIHIDQPASLLNDSLRIFSNPLYASGFGSDGKSLLIHINHFHFKDQNRSKAFIDEVKTLSERLGLIARLVGKLSAQNNFIELIKKDFGKFLGGSILFSLTLLLLIFKNLKTALLPFLISFFSLIWLFGLIGFSGLQINLLSSLLPPIIFFTSMSDAVHLLNAIYKSKNQNTTDRLKESVDIVWTPTMLTSVTTAIGFLSLLMINTQPVQVLGTFAAIGILIAFVITFSFGLIASSFIPISERRVIQIPNGFLQFLLNNKKKVLLAMTLFILVAIPGISKLKIDAYLLDDLPESSSVRADFEYSDSYLGGSKPFELRIDAKNNLKIWDKEAMDEIVKVETYLISTYPVARLQSPSRIIKYLNQANNGGLNQHFSYPSNESSYRKAQILTKRMDPDVLINFISEDQTSARLMGFIKEYGSSETTRRNEQLLEFLDNNIDQTKISYRLTGTTYLIDKSHESLSTNLLKGLVIAILIIAVILGLYFRSIKLLIISLIPNLLPLLIVAGVLGWFDISLKMTTAIIFTIAFGIAVDDTIHMMSYYVRNKVTDGEGSLKTTFFHAGSAMLITSIIMVSGFALFLLSSFGATFYLGMFVSLSLIIALIIDLTILPLLLLTINKK